MCQQQEHTDTVHQLRFTLAFAHCLVEVAAARGAGGTEEDACGTAALQRPSLVADQISSLSREWRSADRARRAGVVGRPRTGSASPAAVVVAAVQNSWFFI